jgi:ABC-2 type transport system permease protein
MAVYKRGYTRYQGERTADLRRLLVLPRFAWANLLNQRVVIILLMVALFYPIGSIAYIYLVNNPTLLAGFGSSERLQEFLIIDSGFFIRFMNVQSTFAIMLASFAGPSLIAPDLANGALPLYFSRPLTRTGYILARMLVLVGVLSPVTWVPGLAVFAMQAGLGGWTWFSANWHLGAGIFMGLALWIVLVSLVAMASSAFVRWRVVAGALVLGSFVLLAGAGTLVNAVLRVEWGKMINPAFAMEQLWTAMLGADALEGPDATSCAVGLVLLSGLLLVILWRRLNPVEVVR